MKSLLDTLKEPLTFFRKGDVWTFRDSDLQWKVIKVHKSIYKKISNVDLTCDIFPDNNFDGQDIEEDKVLFVTRVP